MMLSKRFRFSSYNLGTLTPTTYYSKRKHVKLGRFWVVHTNKQQQTKWYVGQVPDSAVKSATSINSNEHYYIINYLVDDGLEAPSVLLYDPISLLKGHEMKPLQVPVDTLGKENNTWFVSADLNILNKNLPPDLIKQRQNIEQMKK